MDIDLRGTWEEPRVFETEEEVVSVESKEEMVNLVSSWWRRIARWALYGVVFLTPLLFLPYTFPPTLVKQVVVSSLTLVAFIAWLGESLLSGRIYYKRSLMNASLLLLLAVLFLSTLFSQAGLHGFLSSDLSGEKFTSVLVFALLFFLIGGVFYSKEESATLGAWLLGGALLLSLLSLFQIFAPQLVPFSALARADVNTIGTTNALAAFLGLFFVFVLGFLSSRQGDDVAVGWRRILLYVSLVVFFLNLLVINFRPVWIGVLAALIVLLGLKFRRLPRGEGAKPAFFRQERFSLLFLALAIVTFLVLSSTPLIRVASIPAEISPSYNATLSIARQVLNQHRLLGSGPGTFGLDYSLFRDLSINQTNFWGVRFNTGAAFIPTVLATTGILGAAVFVLFMLVALVSLFRQVTRIPEDDPFMVASTAAVVFGFAVLWLYTSTFALGVTLFAMLGLAVARVNESASDQERKSWWRIAERSFTFTAPWTTFTASLFIIFLMVGGVAFLYYNVQQYLAAVAFAKGADVFSNRGDVAGALTSLGRAVSLDPNNDQYYRALAQVLLAQVQSVVSQASANPSPNLQNDFQVAASNAISAAQRATVINPGDSLNWAMLGLVYQTIVPFIQGAEQFAAQAYDRALAADPYNPSYAFSKAATYAALADRSQLLQGQAGGNRDLADSLSKQRADALKQAEVALEKAIQLKPDYAQANYLLAQVLIREGDVTRAIDRVETVKQLAPFDIGVAFQLGVLYYQSANYDKAKAEFERAVSLNENYSNARYFLGLIDDREGNRDAALGEFERILSLNPDNQEVKTIIANLKAKKPALAGISPPAPAPTERKGPPVNDSGQPAGQKNLP